MTGIISRGERLYFRRYAMLFLTFIPSTGKVEQSGLIGRNLISLGICWIIEIQCVGLLESYTKSNRGSQTTCYTYFMTSLWSVWNLRLNVTACARNIRILFSIQYFFQNPLFLNDIFVDIEFIVPFWYGNHQILIRYFENSENIEISN